MRWVDCKDRLPTKADGDPEGDVVCKIRYCGDLILVVVCYEFVNADEYEHWLEGAFEETEEQNKV